ncbi:MAG: alanine racemase [Bacteroidetes bacterium]|nr:alanine racemase [Bacteroidota bacterium]
MNLRLDTIRRPTLLVDEGICRDNIHLMAVKARRLGVKFRPHFKTHQSKLIGHWFREEGTKSITVSSVSMARYFIGDGWEDITIAFPLNLRESDEALELSTRADLNVLITMAEPLESFGQLMKGGHRPVGIFIKIDTGYNRTGLTLADNEKIESIINTCRKHSMLTFKGFLTHTGHTYNARGREEIDMISREAFLQLRSLKDKFDSGPGDLLLSVGDTPACSLLEDFGGMDEIRPGNFVFYDVMQTMIGSCGTSRIAVCLACPVVSKEPSRNEIVVYGGAVHLSKESVFHKGKTIFGLVCSLSDGGWSEPLDDCYVNALSQEHGVIKVSKEVFNIIKPGDLLGILPVHSCLTAQCMGNYLIDGNIVEPHM